MEKYDRWRYSELKEDSPLFLFTILLIEGGKIISIIVATMFNIVAPRIIIVFAEIGSFEVMRL